MVDEQEARSWRKWNSTEMLNFVVGASIAGAFLFIVIIISIAMLINNQPADLRSKLIDNILVPIVLFASGALSGVLASNGIQNKKPKDVDG